MSVHRRSAEVSTAREVIAYLGRVPQAIAA
jgi:hypothetical protein